MNVWLFSRGWFTISQSLKMRTTVTIEKLKRRGYFSFSEQFLKSRRTVSNVTQTKFLLSNEPSAWADGVKVHWRSFDRQPSRLGHVL